MVKETKTDIIIEEWEENDHHGKTQQMMKINYIFDGLTGLVIINNN
jgi:hypothetical protein